MLRLWRRGVSASPQGEQEDFPEEDEKKMGKGAWEEATPVQRQGGMTSGPHESGRERRRDRKAGGRRNLPAPWGAHI